MSSLPDVRPSIAILAFNAWRNRISRNESPAGVPPVSQVPYRPAAWSSGPQRFSLTVTRTTPGQTITFPTNITGSSSTGTTEAVSVTTKYFFDAVLNAEHTTRLRLTNQPVQSGVSLVDHAYAEPDHVVLEVAFSDAMASVAKGQYATNNSKSVSAYQTFVDIQKSRIPLILTTHLQQYANMLIEDIHASDSSQTVAGARFSISFRQIITATVATATVTSARPNATDTTNSGNVAPVPVSPAVSAQHISQVTPGDVAAVRKAIEAFKNFPNPSWCSDIGNGGLRFGH